MTCEDYRNIKVGDIVEITQCGPDKGKVCDVIAISYDRLGWPVVTLELADPREIFLAKGYVGKRYRKTQGYVNLHIFKKG